MRIGRRGFIGGLLALAVAPLASRLPVARAGSSRTITAIDHATRTVTYGGETVDAAASTTFVARMPTGVVLLRENMTIDFYDIDNAPWLRPRTVVDFLRDAFSNVRETVSEWIEEAAG